MTLTPGAKLLLTQARDVLLTKNWTQGLWAQSEDGEAVDVRDPEAHSFCLVGSVWSAFYKHEAPHGALMESLRAMDWEVTKTNPLSGTISWNDTPGRTKEEVISFLENLVKD